MTEVLFSTAEAAHIAGTTEATIRQWVHRGWLTPTYRAPTGNRYRWVDIHEAERQARNRDQTGRPR